MAKDSDIPEAWKNAPRIGSGIPAGQEQMQVQGPNFFGIPFPGDPADWFEGFVYKIVIPGRGDFYVGADAPYVVEPNVIALIQAFAISSDGKQTVLQYRNLVFTNPPPGSAAYLCKPPKWWDTVLNKGYEFPEG